jgi:ElaB/YqjD/DUF883 family membrane-anchored ribosome-binding protein
MNTLSSKLASDATNATAQIRQTSDGLLRTAGHAIDTTRDFANDALDTAEDKVRMLRGEIDPIVDMLASKAQKLARQSLDMAAHAKDRAQQSMSRASDATTRYVSEQPLRSVMIAAAVGAAVALLVSAARHRHQNNH